QPIKVGRRFVGAQSAMTAASAATVPLAAFMRADFNDSELSGITLNMRMTDGSRTATLDRIAVDRNQVRPGETISVTAFMRTPGGVIVPQVFSVAVPKDAAPGPLVLLSAGGTAAQAASSVAQFTPRSAAEMISTLNRLKPSDRLYAILTRTS